MRTLILATVLLASCVPGPYRTGEITPWAPPDDMNQDEFLAYLVAEGSSWVLSQRDAFRPASVQLSDDERAQYSAYFAAETLAAVQYAVVDRIENPGFYDDLAARGVEIPLDFTEMQGIAFVDTVAISRRGLREQDRARLLFHECVHVAQYRHLGVAEFMSQYVLGWANNGFDYFAIPLERQAYELDRRFSQGEVFSAEQIIAETLDQPTDR